MGSGPAAAADVWERASTCSAPRGPVKSEADRSVSGLLSWRVRARTVDLAVVGAGANKTVGFGKSREGNGPQFKVNLIPA